MTRPEPVATADLVAQARREARDAESRRPGGCAVVPIALLFALAKALEDTAAALERAHATLREIAAMEGACLGCADAARERLENP